MLDGLAIVVAGVMTAGPAAAAPTGAHDAGLIPVTVVCGGVTYQIVTNGQGRFTPAHDVATNAILVPSQFGVATIVVTDTEEYESGRFVSAVDSEMQGVDGAKQASSSRLTRRSPRRSTPSRDQTTKTATLPRRSRWGRKTASRSTATCSSPARASRRPLTTSSSTTRDIGQLT